MGAGPGWAGSGVRFGFPTKEFVRRVEETSSRPRRPARGAARGTQRTPSASQVRGGPGSTTAAPVAPAVRELRADRRARLPGTVFDAARGPLPKRRPAGSSRPPFASRAHGGPGGTTAVPVALAAREILGGRRAGLPGSRPAPDEQPSPRGVTRERAPRPVRAYPEALPPKSEGGYPEALPPRWEADCPKTPFRPSPREATRKPGGGSQAEAARRRRAQPAQVGGGLPGNRPAPDEQPTNPTIPPISHPRAAVI